VEQIGTDVDRARAFVLPEGWCVLFPIRAETTHEGLAVSFVVDLDEGLDPPRLVCTRLTLEQLEDGPPIQSRSVRLPIESLVREAIRQNTVRVRDPLAPLEGLPEGSVAHPSYKPRRARRGRPLAVEDDRLRDVARAHRAGGIDRVRKDFSASRTTAYELVARARNAGYDVRR
jgi:hypothetical protein